MSDDGSNASSGRSRVARRPNDGRGIDKLERWARTLLRVLGRSALMVAASAAEFFTERRTYRYLAVSFLYLPLGFTALVVVGLLASRAGYATTEAHLFYGLLVALVPVLGLGVEYARERFLRGFEVRPRSGWTNRTLLGLEIVALFLLFTALAEPIAGGAAGGVRSFLPRILSIPPVPLPGPTLTVTIDELIAAYVFPAAFVVYLYDERLSSLWPPGQFTDVVVDERYVSLAVAWGAIFVVMNNGVATAAGRFFYAMGTLTVPRLALLILGTAWAGTTLLYLSLFTVAANAPHVDALVDASDVSAASTEQSSLERYRG